MYQTVKLAPNTVWSRGYRLDASTPAHQAPNQVLRSCKEKRSKSGNKLLKTAVISCPVLGVFERSGYSKSKWNTGQLETDVAECKETCTSWGVDATNHSCLRVMVMMMKLPTVV